MADDIANMLARYGDEPREDTWHDRWIKPWGSAYPRQPAKWTKEYPDLAAFLRSVVQYAPLALPAARSPLPAMARMHAPTEWPTQAAVRIGDSTFTGNSHFDAVTKAQVALGENALGGGNVATDGFLTNTGRYVSREEAGRLLDDHNQTRHYRTWLGNDKKGKDNLLSEALELYDPKTGRENY